ncbi:MAG: DUF4262 domain-containing protein [Gammaproteobacteria bacterium]|uniref:DUF4262 domain-containing protein n=1 Tax=Phaeodactylibacter xiamenensis TaxID=1524460 RepID=A0A098S101_9BACT|nr:DUF4262 domain-containing protein [Phaeodactylibacter xiamenensis]KGE84797.1 hypothetical protein IX84_31765 [Phaeodactylibacter xiamenensis]MCR9192967.1 DUF4262 domain-containing protein [Gammaproteobacteria bacterium]
MTEKQRNEYFRNVDNNIREFGYHITTVLEDEETTPFGYSTGIFQNFKIPEIFISGLPSGLTRELIENYSNEYRFSKIPILKVLKNLTNRFPVYLTKVSIEKLEEYVLSSIKYYDENHFEYIQLIYPDLKGNFPGEKNYDYDQEIFGKILNL